MANAHQWLTNTKNSECLLRTSKLEANVRLEAPPKILAQLGSRLDN